MHLKKMRTLNFNYGLCSICIKYYNIKKSIKKKDRKQIQSLSIYIYM